MWAQGGAPVGGQAGGGGGGGVSRDGGGLAFNMLIGELERLLLVRHCLRGEGGVHRIRILNQEI